MIEEEKNKACRKVERILRDLDIEMEVGGCGCCGSPWVTFKYRGEIILDDEDDCDLNTKNEK